MSDTKQRKAVKEFVEFWKDKGYEKGCRLSERLRKVPPEV